MDLFDMSSSDEESNEAPTAGVLNETSAADRAFNEASPAGKDEGADEDAGAEEDHEAEEDDGAEEDKGGGPLSGLIEQSKYISESLDNTLAALMKLKGNIQDVSTKIKHNQETSAKTVESLNKIASDISSFNSLIGDFKGAAGMKSGGRAYSVDKRAAVSNIQAEQQAKGEDPIETPA